MLALTSNPAARLLLAACSAAFILSGCQSLSSTAPTATTQMVNADKLERFNITGKIGVSAPNRLTDKTEGGSAFYAWGQEQDRFAIELIGALGIGKTNIEYNGQTATLVSEKTGTLTADDPETLLEQATGWQAPISQLPYWISGRPAPSDSASTLDAQNRLLTAVNGAWQASFSYSGSDTLPNKITVTQPQGQRVIMTINHQNR